MVDEVKPPKVKPPEFKPEGPKLSPQTLAEIECGRQKTAEHAERARLRQEAAAKEAAAEADKK